MVRPSKSLAALVDEFVCVRMTDVRGVDLSRYDFDFDLTFALLTMDADGGVYHRYGGRDERGPGTWLSEASLTRVLEATLAEHAERPERRSSSRQAPLRLERLPSFRKRDRGGCIHCHSVNTTLYEEAREAERLDADWIWKYPTPTRVGFDLDREDQRRVTAVEAESAAAAAGLRVGDLLLSLGETRIASASDVMFALDRAPGGGAELPLVFTREGTRQRARLILDEGWKRGTPREFAWRPTKWALTPAPGFGGPRLEAEELEQLGLAEESFAFRVQYLVTWGDNRRYGQAAAEAGLREGDVVLSVDGRSDFESIEHFHAWWRLTVEVGRGVPIEILRENERHSLHLTAIE